MSLDPRLEGENWPRKPENLQGKPTHCLACRHQPCNPLESRSPLGWPLSANVSCGASYRPRRWPGQYSPLAVWPSGGEKARLTETMKVRRFRHRSSSSVVIAGQPKRLKMKCQPTQIYEKKTQGHCPPRSPSTHHDALAQRSNTYQTLALEQHLSAC